MMDWFRNVHGGVFILVFIGVLLIALGVIEALSYGKTMPQSSSITPEQIIVRLARIEASLAELETR